MFRRNTNNRNKPFYTKWWFWFLIFLLFRNVFSGSGVDVTDRQNTPTTEPDKRIEIPIESGNDTDFNNTNKGNARPKNDGKITMPDGFPVKGD